MSRAHGLINHSFWNWIQSDELLNYLSDAYTLRVSTPLPTGCFLPQDAWLVLDMDNEDLAAGDVLNTVAALATWQLTKGVYRFTQPLFDALWNAPIEAKIPVDALSRLPEWCPFIELPKMQVLDVTLDGFFVRNYYNDATDYGLQFVTITEGESFGTRINVPFGDWTVEEAFMKGFVSRETAQPIIELVQCMLPLVLYLCSDAPEIDHSRKPMERPKRATPTRKGRGYTFQPAKKETRWDVGRAVSQQLISVQQGSMTKTGSSKRPHIRRGHWHGFWRGPRDGERTFHYHWLPPIVVTGTQNE